MKKYLVLFVFNFILVSVCFAQSITLNSIGMHKFGEPGNFTVAPGDDVQVNINYSTTEMIDIQGVYFGSSSESNRSLIRIFPYGTTIPSEASTGSVTIHATSLDGRLVGDNQNANFTFTFPNITGKESFQIAFGLWGTTNSWDDFYGIKNTSYITVGSGASSLLPTPTLATGNYQSYMGLSYDDATDIPVLNEPSSPTLATYDNSSLFIKFQLSEVPLSGSVKLYISPNADGSSPSTTLTLADSYENILLHELELEADNFAVSSPHLIIVEGERSLSHLNTYFLAIGYQDELGNPESFSTWNKLIYDNQVDIPIDSWLTPYYSQTNNEIILSFILNEAILENLVLRIIPHSADGSDRIIELNNYAFAPGEHNIIFRGDDLSASANFVALIDGVNYLTSGIDYRYQLTITDIAGNEGTTNQSDPRAFFWDPGAEVSAEFTEVSPTSAFNCSLTNEYQNLARLRIKANSGSIELNTLTFEVDPASHNSDNITHIKIDDELNSLGIVLDYAGPRSYTVSGINKVIPNTWTNLYISFQIDYNDAPFTADDFISISLEEDDVVTTGDITTFENVTAKKFIKHCLIVDHQNIQPNFTSEDRESPFFRLDLKTNDSYTELVNLVSFRVMGTISADDLSDDKIHLWESPLPTFDQATSHWIQSQPRNSEINFDLNRTITSTTKYYFFTIIASEDVDPAHTILGNIISSNDISSSTLSIIAPHGFPLNSDAVADMTLPVELSSFTTAFTLSNGVNLNWTTESESNISGYHLYRNETDSFDNAQRINPVLVSNGQQNSTQVRYSFNDSEVEIKTTYYYWLESLEYNGFSEFYGPYSVYTDEDINDEDNFIIQQFSQLYDAYPNPFNPDITIPYKLVEDSPVEITIFNIKGQKVKTLISKYQEAGNYSLLFDGKDFQGNKLSSGIYFYKMRTDSYSKINKMILVK